MMNCKEIIQNEIERKRLAGEKWENEYGSFETNAIKHKYENITSYDIHFYEKDNVMYFKIVPRYFTLPCGYAYWEYYDGYVENGKVKFMPTGKIITK